MSCLSCSLKPAEQRGKPRQQWPEANPEALKAALDRWRDGLVRVGLEAGATSEWIGGHLVDEGFPIICLESRRVKAALSAMTVKTNRNDAQGIAQIVRTGWFKAVHLKSAAGQRLRTLTAARKAAVRALTGNEQVIRGLLRPLGLKIGAVTRVRFEATVRQLIGTDTRLVRITTELSNQIRGIMKTFGLVVPPGKGTTFEKNVRRLLVDQDQIASIVLPMLAAWRDIRIRAAELGRQLIAEARQSRACQILMSIPGIGVITATSFATAIEDPDNFKKSRSVAAWIGLTTRRYQSGEVDYEGHISRRGDRHLRGLLYEAAAVILTRCSAESGLRTWGLKLRERIGFKRAAVAVARKLAVIMHTMLKTGEFFNPNAGATT